MQFVDWIIVLAIALMSIAFFCGRGRACRSPGERTRRLRGTRLLVQATIALWAVPLIFQQSFVSLAGMSAAPNLPPRVALGAALLLLITGSLWLIRGGRLLQQRRMFRTP